MVEGTEVTGSTEGVANVSETAATTPDTTTQETASSGDTTPRFDPGNAGQVEAKPAWALNPKFKVLDKEHEFDEFIRPVIKDAETEKKVRELYEKAYGIEPIKADRQSLREQLAEEKQRSAERDRGLEVLSSYIQNDDLDSFFEATNIPKSKVLKYALELVQREQWTPEQKAAWQQQRDTAARVTEYEQQNQQLMERQQQLMVQQREFELSTVLARPDITQIAQAYEAGMGTPGAFREFVINIGQAFAARGQDIPAEQAVNEAVKHLRAMNPSLGQTAAQPQGQATPGVVMPNQKPVIPNIQGRGTSPVRSTVKSLDDIKKRYAELSAQQ